MTVCSLRFFLGLVSGCSCLSSILAQQSFVPARVLIYSATADFRHDSIPTAIEAMRAKGSSINVQFDNTEDKSQFTDSVLGQYDALLFLMNTGEVLDGPGKAAFQKYLNLGGNFIAIHAASDALRNTTFYGDEVGAFFDYHPEVQNATIDIIGPSHPSTNMLPTEWQVRDEMYNFKSDPRTIGAIVVLSANESSYTDSGVRKFDQGVPHPTAWFQEHGAGVEGSGVPGRSFYTSLGHLNETWADPLFIGHVMGGLSWTLRSNTTRAANASAQVGNAGISTIASGPTQSSSATSSSAASTPSESTSSHSGAWVSKSKFKSAIVLLMVAAVTWTVPITL